MSIAILVTFAAMAVLSGAFNPAALFDMAPAPGTSSFLPLGVGSILFALPFAMWLFLGIEELPLAAEEAHDPERDIPRAGRGGLITLIATGTLVVVLNPGVVGATAIGPSTEPLLDGFRAIIPGDIAAILHLRARRSARIGRGSCSPTDATCTPVEGHCERSCRSPVPGRRPSSL